MESLGATPDSNEEVIVAVSHVIRARGVLSIEQFLGCSMRPLWFGGMLALSISDALISNNTSSLLSILRTDPNLLVSLC
jgi:hypothetical protein